MALPDAQKRAIFAKTAAKGRVPAGLPAVKPSAGIVGTQPASGSYSAGAPAVPAVGSSPSFAKQPRVPTAPNAGPASYGGGNIPESTPRVPAAQGANFAKRSALAALPRSTRRVLNRLPGTGSRGAGNPY
jgi:hypothetical protein